jgi:GT2 family glycosyltransferase
VIPGRVTVSLVTFNGMRWLDGCLASIAEQQVDDLELVVLDNASTDGTAASLRERLAHQPSARLIESPTNLGYAAAHNRVIAEATGEFVLLLNQDVELDARFLAEALPAFAGRASLAAVQGRIRRLGADGTRSDTLDSTGLELHRDRRAVARGQGAMDGPEHATPGPVFGADGPAPVYRMEALMDARLPRTKGGWEVLDEDFFMYKEDVDLGWRLRILGWEAWYVPAALAWHARGAAGPGGTNLWAILRSSSRLPRWIKALSWRNQRLMQVKNESLPEYVRDLPWILRRELLSLAFIVVADPLRLSAIPLTLKALPGAARKRRYLRRRARARRSTTRAA